MASTRISTLLVLATACNFPRPMDVPGEPDDAAIGSADAAMGPTDAPDDVGIDAPGMHARCDPAKPFGTPTHVEKVNSSLDEVAFSLTRDEKIAFVGRSTILVAQRASTTVAFDVPDGGPTVAINGAVGTELGPSPVSDGLILYFHRQTPTDVGIFAATRADTSASFDAGMEVTVDGLSLTNALSPTISSDGQTLYWLDFNDFGKVFSATRNGGATRFVNRRAASTIAIGFDPVLSADELTMFYSTGFAIDVLVSTRASKADMFGTGIPVANVNSAANDVPVALTNDGCVLYISSLRSGGIGGYDIWEAHRPL